MQGLCLYLPLSFHNCFSNAWHISTLVTAQTIQAQCKRRKTIPFFLYIDKRRVFSFMCKRFSIANRKKSRVNKLEVFQLCRISLHISTTLFNVNSFHCSQETIPSRFGFYSKRFSQNSELHNSLFGKLIYYNRFLIFNYKYIVGMVSNQRTKFGR